MVIQRYYLAELRIVFYRILIKQTLNIELTTMAECGVGWGEDHMIWRNEENECFTLTCPSGKSIANDTKWKIKKSTKQIIYKNEAKHRNS